MPQRNSRQCGAKLILQKKKLLRVTKSEQTGLRAGGINSVFLLIRGFSDISRIGNRAQANASYILKAETTDVRGQESRKILTP